MRNTILLLVFFTTGFVPFVFGQTILPAFPSAEGFGRIATGGRGGVVYHVTTLNDNSSAGSFRYAVNQPGVRTIVFDVSGTIHLTAQLRLGKGNVTIAGQTAPGDGICLADYPFVISADNVIIRYMHFRMGDVYAQEADGLGGMDHKNIIVDHCSISWSTDECCSVYGNENMTIQWCMIYQSLRQSVNKKGTHGYGGNWGGKYASYHHNLLAHHDSRTPRLGPRPGTQEYEWMDFRNNVIYNWAGNGCYGGEGMKVNIVNNYYKPGPATNTKGGAVKYRIAKIGIRTTAYCTASPSFAPMLHVWGKFYVDGNYIVGNSEVTNDNWTKGIYAQISNSECDNLFTSVTKDTIKLTTPLDAGVVTTQTATDAYSLVLNYAGCSLRRDTLDKIVVNDTRNATATFGSSSGYKGLIDSQSEVTIPGTDTPWPTLASTIASADTDGDGMPDVWENAHGLNPTDASDGTLTNADGFTNLEVYLNSLVSGITESQNGSAMSVITPVSTGGVYLTSSKKQVTINGVTKSIPIRVYSLAGNMVKQFEVAADATFYLNSGYYIVQAGTVRNKILVE
jgi:hypothetical protein